MTPDQIRTEAAFRRIAELTQEREDAESQQREQQETARLERGRFWWLDRDSNQAEARL